ncbi:3-keto-disaccharide hydrolase [Arenibacter certesii]|uniref:3-keto-alpha-glucoside-1,2-lyase/3-keto-2-hydroxy-glucal hydratase domain-containing protein n=1 Tax=Arenibacter certesii TaxID=228955 RepID=A0A918MQ87_9FLAO|nr:DUF1080 domain-containing protein [Arenibacter certesii]GGW46556.1 hypothetical protein GCM10007383_33490 [Arenibacter certesii]
MKDKFVLALVLIFSLTVFSQQPKLKDIFNGRNLNGWIVPTNNIWWSAENGMLIGKSDPEKKGSILWTKNEFKDFEFETEFRFGEGTVDSGIFIRNDKQQIQLGISGALKRDMTASPYIAGLGYPVEAHNINRILKPKDWNTIKVIAIAGYYEVWLNHIHVMSYTSESFIEQGPIGLQVHPNNEMTISFRNTKVANLK